MNIRRRRVIDGRHTKAKDVKDREKYTHSCGGLWGIDSALEILHMGVVLMGDLLIIARYIRDSTVNTIESTGQLMAQTFLFAMFVLPIGFIAFQGLKQTVLLCMDRLDIKSNEDNKIALNVGSFIGAVIMTVIITNYIAMILGVV